MTEQADQDHVVRLVDQLGPALLGEDVVPGGAVASAARRADAVSALIGDRSRLRADLVLRGCLGAILRPGVPGLVVELYGGFGKLLAESKGSSLHVAISIAS